VPTGETTKEIAREGGKNFMDDSRKKISRKRPAAPEKTAAPFRAEKTDPQGSYTGRPERPWEEPVQDADDL